MQTPRDWGTSMNARTVKHSPASPEFHVRRGACAARRRFRCGAARNRAQRGRTTRPKMISQGSHTPLDTHAARVTRTQARAHNEYEEKQQPAPMAVLGTCTISAAHTTSKNILNTWFPPFQTYKRDRGVSPSAVGSLGGATVSVACFSRSAFSCSLFSFLAFHQSGAGKAQPVSAHSSAG